MFAQYYFKILNSYPSAYMIINSCFKFKKKSDVATEHIPSALAWY